MRRLWRLVDATVLLLVLLLPLMLMLGAAERTAARTTVLFWLLLLLPLVILPLLWRRADPEEGAQAQAAAARRLGPEPATHDGLAAAVAPVIDVRRTYSEHGLAVAEGVLRQDSATAFARLEQLLAPHKRTPLLQDQGAGGVRVIALPQAVDAALRRRPSIATNVLLFLATVATTIWAGALHQGINLLSEPDRFMVGVPYAAALLGMLGVHEFGHYFTARRYGVDVTLPYFIPVPMGLGTFGAFIQIKSLIKSRRAVFDIGIAGPLAGLLVALPALYIGLRGTPPLADALHTTGVYSGSSVLLALMYQFANGGELGSAVIRLSPIAFAGWIGLFITALNLLPVGQLDGGHIAYGLFGQRWARRIGIGAFLAMLGLGLSVWPGLLTWALMIALIAGFAHMPALDDVTPLDGKRFALGGLACAVLVLTLMPLPVGMRGLMLDCPYM
jgi:membrane-associated protease RseP (regulator of RpoE activity)